MEHFRDIHFKNRLFFIFYLHLKQDSYHKGEINMIKVKPESLYKYPNESLREALPGCPSAQLV